jgi:hypothetical protein
METAREKVGVQFGTSLTASLEEDTWTFLMGKGYAVSAGEFAIMPIPLFNELRAKAEAYEKSKVTCISRE